MHPSLFLDQQGFSKLKEFHDQLQNLELDMVLAQLLLSQYLVFSMELIQGLVVCNQLVPYFCSLLDRRRFLLVYLSLF